jgi:hypothetical protein
VGRLWLDAFQASRWRWWAFGRLMFVERDLHCPRRGWRYNGLSVSSGERRADRRTRWVREPCLYRPGDWPRDLIRHLEARQQTDQRPENSSRAPVRRPHSALASQTQAQREGQVPGVQPHPRAYVSPHRGRLPCHPLAHRKGPQTAGPPSARAHPARPRRHPEWPGMTQRPLLLWAAANCGSRRPQDHGLLRRALPFVRRARKSASRPRCSWRTQSGALATGHSLSGANWPGAAASRLNRSRRRGCRSQRRGAV